MARTTFTPILRNACSPFRLLMAARITTVRSTIPSNGELGTSVIAPSTSTCGSGMGTVSKAVATGGVVHRKVTPRDLSLRTIFCSSAINPSGGGGATTWITLGRLLRRFFLVCASSSNTVPRAATVRARSGSRRGGTDIPKHAA